MNLQPSTVRLSCNSLRIVAADGNVTTFAASDGHIMAGEGDFIQIVYPDHKVRYRITRILEQGDNWRAECRCRPRKLSEIYKFAA